MGIYNFLVNGYFQILAVFPGPLQWFVSLLLLVAFVWVFGGLIRSNILFVILLIILLPVFLPILVRLLTEMLAFLVFLLRQVGVGV